METTRSSSKEPLHRPDSRGLPGLLPIFGPPGAPGARFQRRGNPEAPVLTIRRGGLPLLQPPNLDPGRLT
jgi:hypothetical protein